MQVLHYLSRRPAIRFFRLSSLRLSYRLNVCCFRPVHVLPARRMEKSTLEHSNTPRRGNVPNSPSIPSGFILEQNYPNPFNPTTVISYKLSVISYIELKIFDLLGREVVTLVNETKSPGTHTAKWDGINASGQRTASGIYFYRMQTPYESSVKKLVLTK